MNGEKLFRSIGLLPDEMLLEADGPIAKKRHIPKRWGALAACAVLGIFCLFRLVGAPGTDSTNMQGQDAADQLTAGETTELPQTLEPITLGWENGDLGFEGITAASADVLESGCPWTEADGTLASLPVYASQNELVGEGAARFGLNADEMEQQLRQLASAVGYEVETVTISPDEAQIQDYRDKLTAEGRNPDTDPNYEINTRPYAARAVVQGTKFEVVTTGEFTMTLAEPAALPEEYRLTQDSSRADAEKTALWLAQQYAGALEIEDPQPQVQLEYSATGEKQFSLRVRSGGEIARQLLEYSFGGLQFYLNEAGEYTGLRLWGTQAAGESLGEYPLISAQQAVELLAEGRCYTSVTELFPGIDYLAGIELVYREGSGSVAPYYRLWVELPTLTREDGLRTFGAYYVPAVKMEYLNDPPSAQWETDQ